MSWDSPSWKKAARDYHAEVEVEPARMKANGRNDYRPAKTNAIKLTFFDECSDHRAEALADQGCHRLRRNVELDCAAGQGQVGLAIRYQRASCRRRWIGAAIAPKGKFGVVYFAFERADLVKRRNAAYAKRLDLNGLPIAIASQIINLMQPHCVDVILATIRAAEEPIRYSRRPYCDRYLRQRYCCRRWR